MEDNGKSKNPQIDALIFDLDGVVTQTRKLHKKAWKQLFDQFFASSSDFGDQKPMSEADYVAHIDGKPRYDGVRDFLESRSIDMPFGKTADPPGMKSICGLGNHKNELFRKVLDSDGADVYENAVSLIKKWRKKGGKTAIVSSSKNCKAVLERAGLSELFDVRVDGLTAEELGLKGKPDPDIFLKAAGELNARPENSVVFEDATSGVQAGQRGFFGLVVGVARFENEDDLRKNGADLIIKDFKAFDLESNEVEAFFLSSTPHVFSDNSKLFDLISAKKPAFFLDYDGTLTPIVKKPEDAVLSDEMRNTLEKLSERFTVAVVTGRDKEDVQQFIKLDQIIYSGSHGYVTSGPDGLFMEHEDAEKIKKGLDMVEEELNGIFGDAKEGVQIDRKKYAIAVHYRNATKQATDKVFEVVKDLLEKHDEYKKGEGKRVVEIKPNIDWHKGKAVLWIMERLGIDKDDDIIPVFIGDDVTDEDAFEALKNKGIGILVENHGQDTAASYSLKNVYQVRVFFEKVLHLHHQK